MFLHLSVSHSVHRGGQVHPRDQVHPPGPGTPPGQVHPSGPGTPPWAGTPPRTRYNPPPGPGTSPGPGTPQETATVADGTNPTGMHSCVRCIQLEFKTI